LRREVESLRPGLPGKGFVVWQVFWARRAILGTVQRLDAIAFCRVVKNDLLGFVEDGFQNRDQG